MELKKAWRLWAKALGEKAGSTDKEADMIALIRTIIVLMTFLMFITGVPANIVLMLNAHHHW